MRCVMLIIDENKIYEEISLEHKLKCRI